MPPTFRFGNDKNQGIAPELQNPIDSLIDAAGGAPLPGIFGLTQALFEIWGSPRHNANKVLFYGKAGLNTAGAIRSYIRHRNPSLVQKKEDPVRAFLESQNLTQNPDLRNLGEMIHNYFLLEGTHEDLLLGGSGEKSKSSFLRKFSSGEESFYFVMHGSDNPEFFSGIGPYFKISETSKILEGISQQIWNVEKSGDLQLSSTETWNGMSFSLVNIGPPDDYISEGAGSESNHLSLSDRCRRFTEKGFNRKVLFHGPPGTGKSSLARRLASSVSRTLRIEASTISSAGSTAIFQFIKLLNPRVILFDDLDRLGGYTEEFLHFFEKQGSSSSAEKNGLLIIATVNSVKQIDPAMLRPGRFDEVISIKEPEDAHRTAVISHYLKKFKISGNDVEDLSIRMRGLAQADIREILLVLSVIGPEVLDTELTRIRTQRELFSGDAVERFLARKTVSKDDDRGDIKPPASHLV